MNRRLARAVLAVALLGVTATAAPISFAGTVPGTEPAPGEEQPTGDTLVDESGVDPTVEIVQSWTLTTGSENGQEPGSRANFTYQVQPGAVIEDTVVVYNLGNVPLLFRVYATDAFNNDDGQFDLLPGEEVPIGAGSWVQLVQESIILDPGKQATIPFTLTVPLDAAPGDHAGAIVAGTMTSADTGTGQVVDVERRTGTRLFVEVEGDLVADLAVASLSSRYTHAPNPFGGRADVSFNVENRGNVRLSGTPIISVGGPFGLMSKEIRLDPITDLLPGQSVDLAASLDGVPALFLNSTEVRIDVDEPTARGDARDTVVSVGTFAPPITLLLLLALVLLGVLARRTLRRRSRAALPVVPTIKTVEELEPQHR